jgi:hypothetical protein
VAALVERVNAIEWRPSEIMYSETGVLRDRLDEVTAERDFLRSLVNRLSAAEVEAR